MVFAFASVVVAGVSAWSAMVTKSAMHSHSLEPLAALSPAETDATPVSFPLGAPDAAADASEIVESVEVVSSEIRYFNGRPVRPVRTMWMTVTAYSPDERSCGKFADGITASLHSVWTNGMKLVAADSRVLPLGSMISVPGYDSGAVVPVLDRGGAIKGARLDVLYPTHEIARRWGVQRLPITVWEYADGEPAPNWRKLRDGR